MTKYDKVSIGDWRGIAQALRPQLSKHAVLLLSGPLGAGKTTFVQALFAVAGVDALVNSPTFSLVEEYVLHPGESAEQRLIHADLFRLETVDPELLAYLQEAATEAQLTVIEWPERLPTNHVFANVWKLDIATAGDVRSLTVESV